MIYRLTEGQACRESETIPSLGSGARTAVVRLDGRLLVFLSADSSLAGFPAITP